MGMYTGIRFKGYVKPEYRAAMAEIAMHGNWDESEVPEFAHFGEMGRSCFIPCGSLSYMPDEWEDKYNMATDGFERSYNEETGYWTFQCSLKNYNYEIEVFFNLLPLFIESIEHLEYYYEEMAYSEKYELIDGKVILTVPYFILYDKYGIGSDVNE